MAKVNKTCCMCQSTYSYCGNCPATVKEPSYKMSFCSEKCRDICNALTAYGMGKISKEECAVVLKMYDTADIDKYDEGTRNLMLEVLKEPKPEKKKVRAEMKQESK